MRAPISGAAPILPDETFTPLTQRLREASFSPALLPPVKPSEPAAVHAPAITWTMPLVDRRPSAEEKAADLAPDLIDALLRIESLYDPTRVDLLADAPVMEVRPGTASMNNVFADRWHLADTDPNVHYRVRYLAQAWLRGSGDAGCDAFSKNRRSDGGPALTALAKADCERLARLAADHDESWTRMVLAGASLDLPIFAAPLPGARLSSTDFWAEKKARIAAIQARLQSKWQATPTSVSAR